MITIISATNRPGNSTKIFADKFFQLIKQRGVEAQMFSLEEIPDDFGLKNIYDYNHPGLSRLVEKYIIPANKLLVVVPEYNAGIPGVLKVFIDAVKPEFFAGKTAALVGISSGRSGNIRGIDQLTNIFHYINMQVLPYKLPISRIEELLNEKRELVDEFTIKGMKQLLDQFLE
ncbi:MAG: NAD(P)H-dependent oxidoreductase [Bacteroidetes bacterium]|nr:NAD(P)H-dependent oxidoreductase [Bacteroidota bacterium]HET6244375.1 NAD(P)H-dependent oxidoreductase [Bacteroidia bacterium]